MLSRRAFISRVMGAVAAGAVLDVDKLLWVPGAKSIFIPEPKIILPRLLAGDVFSIEGYFAVNPLTGRKTDMLQLFVATETVSVGDQTIALVPYIEGQSRHRPLGKIRPAVTPTWAAIG